MRSPRVHDISAPERCHARHIIDWKLDARTTKLTGPAFPQRRSLSFYSFGGRSSHVTPLDSRSPNNLKASLPKSPARPARRMAQRDWCERILASTTTALKRLYSLWDKIQVSHCGTYSVERMIAFDEYCRSVSSLRVTTVCLLTPLPAVFLVTIMELLPLRSPDVGCLANYVFWLRHWFAIGIILLAGFLKCKQAINELSVSQLRMAAVSFTSSGIYVAMNVAAACLWVFPIPFLAVLGGLVMFPIWVAGIVLAVGYRTLAGIPDIRERFVRFLDLSSTEGFLMILYPANNAVFETVPASYRSAYLVLLPVINLVMKNVVVAKGAHLEDRLPEIVVFSVDVFSALYSVFCMRIANTLLSVGIAVAIDAFVIALAFYGLSRRTIFTREMIYETTAPSDRPRQRSAVAITSVSDSISSPLPSIPRRPSMVLALASPAVSQVLAQALYMLERPGQLDAASLHDIRLLSTAEHRLSAANVEMLSMLKKRAIYDNKREQDQPMTLSQMKLRYATGSSRKLELTNEINEHSRRRKSSMRTASNVRTSEVLDSCVLINGNEQAESSLEKYQAPPKPTLRSLLHSSALNSVLMLTRKKNTAIVHEVLQLLFTSEYLVLIAYVQCIIPPMFVLYMSALHNLPNVVFYPRAVELSSEDEMQKRMMTIAFFWGLKLLQLLFVHWLLTRKFAIAAMYQIAFVLDTHALLVQCKLMYTLIFAVQSSAAHYGADYTFRFEWMRGQSTEAISDQNKT